MSNTVPVVEDDMQVVDTGYEDRMTIQRIRYQVGKGQEEDNRAELEINSELGLACERLPKGVELDQLWKIV